MNTYNTTQLPYFVPKNIPLPIIKEKLLTDSAKLFPEKYSKKNLIKDDFAKMYINNRQLAGQILSNKSTSKGKDQNFILNLKLASLNFNEKEERQIKNNIKNKSPSNTSDSQSRSNSISINSYMKSPHVERNKFHFSQRYKNFPSIKRYKEMMEYSKIPLTSFLES